MDYSINQNPQNNQLQPEPKKHIPTWIGFLIVIVFSALVFGGVIVYQYFTAKQLQLAEKELQTQQILNKPFPLAGEDVESPADTAGWKTYKNVEYGFEMLFPDSWKDYEVEKISWDGSLFEKEYSGPEFIFRNQKLFIERNFYGIPIMIFTPDIWPLVEEEKLAVGSAPMAPGKIGENSKYVFAIPGRWQGFADTMTESERFEVLSIVETFEAF